MLNLAIPAITTDLDASATQMLWILDIYSLVLAGLLVSAGALSDRLGRRRVLLAGCALFGVASALAAFAPSAEALIAARVLMGIGGATILPSTLAIIRSVFEVPRERTLAIGLWSAMAAAAQRPDRSSAACCWNASGGARCSLSTFRSCSFCSWSER